LKENKDTNVFDLVENKKIRIETIMFICKLYPEKFEGNPNWEKYRLRIKKYIVLMESKLDWERIKNIMANHFEEELIK